MEPSFRPLDVTLPNVYILNFQAHIHKIIEMRAKKIHEIPQGGHQFHVGDMLLSGSSAVTFDPRVTKLGTVDVQGTPYENLVSHFVCHPQGS